MRKFAKTLAALFGTSLLVLSMIPFAAGAETVESGDFIFEVSSGEATLTKYTGEDENVVIPADADGAKVTAIGDRAFDMNSDLVSVEIPEGVTKIGDHAFAINSSLETVTLPSTLTEVAEAGFEQCKAIQTVNFGGDESAWSAVTFGAKNDEIQAATIMYGSASTSETTSSEASSSETTSSESTTSETASSESTSSESTTGETTSSEDAAPAAPQSKVNIAYLIGGILIGIAVLDIIYYSIKKPQDDPADPNA